MQAKRKAVEPQSDMVSFRAKVRALSPAKESEEEEGSYAESSICLVCDNGKEPTSSRHFLFPSLSSRVDHARFHRDLGGRDYWETYKDCFVLSKSPPSRIGEAMSLELEREEWDSEMEGDDEYSDTEVEEFSRDFASRSSLHGFPPSDSLHLRGSPVLPFPLRASHHFADMGVETEEFTDESEEELMSHYELDTSGSLDFFGDLPEESFINLIDQSAKECESLRSGLGYIDEEDFLESELDCEEEFSYTEDYCSLQPALGEDGAPKIIELESSELETEGKQDKIESPMSHNMIEIGSGSKSQSAQLDSSSEKSLETSRVQGSVQILRDDASEEEV